MFELARARFFKYNIILLFTTVNILYFKVLNVSEILVYLIL